MNSKPLLTKSQRRSIRMDNHRSLKIAAFLSLGTACTVTLYWWWLPIPLLIFSGWCFHRMHLYGLEEIPEGQRFSVSWLSMLAAFFRERPYEFYSEDIETESEFIDQGLSNEIQELESVADNLFDAVEIAEETTQV